MKMRLLASIFLAAMLMLPCQSVLSAEYGLNVFDNDSIGIFYFNLGKAYKILREKLGEIDKTATPEMKKQFEEMFRNLPENSPFGKDMTIGKLKEIADKWHNDAIFIPTGGVWISVDRQLQPKIVIEAQSKLEKIAEFLKTMPNSERFDFTPKNGVITINPGVVDLPAELNSERIKIGKISENPVQPDKSWQTCYKRLSSPDQHLALELDVPAVIESVLSLHQAKAGDVRSKACAANMRVLMAATEMYNMDNEVPLNSVDMDALVKGQYLKEPLTCPDGGTYSSTGNLAENGEIVCSIHNTVSDLKQSDTPEQQSKINVAHHLPDPRLQHIVRARMFVDTNGLLLAVAVKDETVRQQFKEILQQGFKALEQQLLQSKGDNETVKKMFAELNFIDQKPWLGFSAKQSEKEQVLVGTAIVGIIAAIAVPNFKKARFEAQKRACFANQRVLLGATEMYNMDNEVPLSGLNIKALLDGRYIKSAPKCPAGGVYSATGDLAKDGRIKCSVHGSVDW